VTAGSHGHTNCWLLSWVAEEAAAAVAAAVRGAADAPCVFGATVGGGV
jgi:hypothetical protein